MTTQPKRSRRWRRLFRPDPAPRRRFLVQGLALAGAGIAALASGQWWTRLARKARVFIPIGAAPIRPPGAVKNDLAFQAACVHCGLCANVCDAGCIRFFGADDDEHGALTPYLDVRQRACTLCMKCTNICPSGALRPIERDLVQIKAKVRMGVAEVTPELCLSYLGRVCGYCHDACPLPTHAIKLIPPATPVVIVDGCVGCGRCVEFCPQNPTAIRVVNWEVA